MPIYEYLCTACDHRTDILHGINEDGPKFCPSCGREGTMRKQFAAPAIHYKGSGWAKKDRGSASSTRSSKSSSDGGATDGAKDGAKDGAGSSSSSTSSSSSSSTSDGGSSSSASTDTSKPAKD